MDDNPKPLARAHRQRLLNGETQIIQSYETDIPVRDPNAYLLLEAAGLPLLDGSLTGSPSFKVQSVDISPSVGRSDRSVVSYVYSNRPNAGGVATTSNQPPNEFVISLVPVSATEPVKYAKVFPYLTRLRDPNNPDAELAVQYTAAFEEKEKSLRRPRAKLTCTVTGAPAVLGIPNTLSVQDIEAIVDQQDIIHVIDGLPMMFNIATIRLVRRGFSGADDIGTRVAITYEWLYDRGTSYDTLPDGYGQDPEIGRPDELVSIPNAIGRMQIAPDGGVYTGAVLPNVQAPADLNAVLPEGRRGPFVAPPYCTVDVGAVPTESDIVIPEMTVTREYRRIEPNGWASMPGLGP